MIKLTAIQYYDNSIMNYKLCLLHSYIRLSKKANEMKIKIMSSPLFLEI